MLTKTYFFQGISRSGTRLSATTDGGFVISGRATTGTFTKTKVILFKVDSSGTFVWGLRSNDVDQYIYNGDAMISPDGDILLGGRADKPGGSLDDSFLLRVSNSGEVRWLRTYGVNDYSLNTY